MGSSLQAASSSHPLDCKRQGTEARNGFRYTHAPQSLQGLLVFCFDEEKSIAMNEAVSRACGRDLETTWSLHDPVNMDPFVEGHGDSR